MSEKSLQSVMQEHRHFAPAEAFAENAYPGKDALHRLRDHARRDPEGFWAEQARGELHWHKPFTEVLDASRAPNYRWFADGQLNVSYNCLDAQLPTRRNDPALIFESEAGTVRRLTYGELHAEVC